MLRALKELLSGYSQGSLGISERFPLVAVRSRVLSHSLLGGSQVLITTPSSVIILPITYLKDLEDPGGLEVQVFNWGFYVPKELAVWGTGLAKDEDEEEGDDRPSKRQKRLVKD